jgi:leucyl/phenylalanyl-tRNA--protein transferase
VLTTELLLSAYRQGVFPMADDHGEIGWYFPERRGLIPLDERFHLPHGLKRTLKRNRFTITADRDFEGVIRACSAVHGKTWISGEIQRAYLRLHRDGHAHSIEAWLGDELAGGLYGVHLGAAFFGESMFHHATDASKVALVALVERLRARGFLLLDTQWNTPHLATFGTVEVTPIYYLRLLKKALARDCSF